MKIKCVLLVLMLVPFNSAHADDKSWFENSKQWVKNIWQSDAKHWLARINPAVMNHNYSGEMVFVQGSEINSLYVEHRMQGGVETLQLRSLSGAPRELIKRGNAIQTQNNAKQNRFDMGKAAEQTSFAQFANAADNKWYSVKLDGESRVAGREVQIIAIQAKDALRYSYRLYLDRETGLPLRVETISTSGALLEQVVFTKIQISTIASNNAATPPANSKNNTLENPFETVAGFRLVALDKQKQSSHYLYNDGLASVSLYVEPSLLKQKAQMSQHTVNGLMFGNGTTRYVVMGKAPQETLERLLLAAQTAKK